MGISCGRGSIIFFILVGFFNYNIIQCLCAQLSIACSLHHSVFCNGKLGINAFPGNFAEVIRDTIVIIIIVIGCKNDIAAGIFSFSSLEVSSQACININFTFDIY